VFSSVVEWCIFVALLIEFSALAVSQEDVLTCVAVAFSLAIAGIVTLLVANTGKFQRAWYAGGGVVAITMIGTASYVGGSAFLLGFPVFGALLIMRIIQLQDCDDPVRVIGRWFRIESILVPVFIAVCIWAAPSNYFMPRSVLGVAAAAFIALRLFGMLTLQRVALRRGQYSPGLLPILFLVGVVIVMLGLASVAPYITNVLANLASRIAMLLFYVFNFLSGLLPVLKGKPRTGPAGGGGGNINSEKYPSWANHVTHQLPTWTWVVLAVAVLIGLWALFKFRARKNKITGEVKTETIRKKWMKRREVPMLDTASYVRRKYQSLLRIMERRGFAVRTDETAREYSQRLENQYPSAASEGFTKGMQLLTGAYESARYAQPDSETADVKQRADQGFQSLETAMNKKIK